MQNGGEVARSTRELEAASGQEILEDRAAPVSSDSRPNSSGAPMRLQASPSGLLASHIFAGEIPTEQNQALTLRRESKRGKMAGGYGGTSRAMTGE